MAVQRFKSTAGLDANNTTITNIADPVSDNDAANKLHVQAVVDDAIAAIEPHDPNDPRVPAPIDGDILMGGASGDYESIDPSTLYTVDGDVVTETRTVDAGGLVTINTKLSNAIIATIEDNRLPTNAVDGHGVTYNSASGEWESTDVLIDYGLVETYNSTKTTPAPDVVIFEADISSRAVFFDYELSAYGPMTEKDLALSYQVSDDGGATWSGNIYPRVTITSPYNADDSRHVFFRSQVSIGVLGQTGDKTIWINETITGMNRTDTAGRASMPDVFQGYDIATIPDRIRWLFTGTESITEQFKLTATTINFS